MRINKIFIRSFGRFINKEFSFSDGFNIIYGENESGKSTIMQFIRMMFYGTPYETATKRGNPKITAAREKYRTKNHNAVPGGIIWFTSSKGVPYMLDREFREHNIKDKITLTNLSTNTAEPTNDMPGERADFFNMPCAVFDKSIFISSAVIDSSDKSGNSELVKALANLTVSADADISAEVIDKRLEAAVNGICTGSRSKKQLKDSILLSEKEQELEDAKKHATYMDKLEKECIELKNSIQEDTDEIALLNKKTDSQKIFSELETLNQQRALCSELEQAKHDTESLKKALSVGGVLVSRTWLDEQYDLIKSSLVLKDEILHTESSAAHAQEELNSLKNAARSMPEKLDPIEQSVSDANTDISAKEEQLKNAQEQLDKINSDSERLIRESDRTSLEIKELELKRNADVKDISEQISLARESGSVSDSSICYNYLNKELPQYISYKDNIKALDREAEEILLKLSTASHKIYETEKEAAVKETLTAEYERSLQETKKELLSKYEDEKNALAKLTEPANISVYLWKTYPAVQQHYDLFSKSLEPLSDKIEAQKEQLSEIQSKQNRINSELSELSNNLISNKQRIAELQQVKTSGSSSGKNDRTSYGILPILALLILVVSVILGIAFSPWLFVLSVLAAAIAAVWLIVRRKSPPDFGHNNSETDAEISILTRQAKKYEETITALKAESEKTAGLYTAGSENAERLEREFKTEFAGIAGKIPEISKAHIDSVLSEKQRLTDTAVSELNILKSSLSEQRSMTNELEKEKALITDKILQANNKMRHDIIVSLEKFLTEQQKSYDTQIHEKNTHIAELELILDKNGAEKIKLGNEIKSISSDIEDLKEDVRRLENEKQVVKHQKELDEQKTEQAQKLFDELTVKLAGLHDTVKEQETALETALSPYAQAENESKKDTLDRISHLFAEYQSAETRYEERKKLAGNIDSKDDIIYQINELNKKIEENKYRPLTDDELADTATRISILHEKQNAVSQELGAKLAELKQARSSKAVSQIEYEISGLKKEIKAKERFRKSIDVAREVLGEAHTEMCQTFAPDVDKKTTEYFSALTNDRYSNVLVSRSFEVTPEEKGSAVYFKLDQLSSGTADQIYLAVRLAVASILGGSIFFLDDIFMQADDARTAQGLKLLKNISAEHQIFLFTCHKSISDNKTISAYVQDISTNKISV